jgi:hypothetical protein
MADLTSQGARQLRAERLAQARRNWDGWQPPDDDSPNAGCMLAFILVLSLLTYGAGWAAIYFLIR